MRELTVPDMAVAVSLLRSGVDPVAALVASKRARVQAIECFAKIRSDWSTLPVRNKLRHVLGHGVAFGPAELAALTGHKLNTVISTLARMRSRGEVKRERHGKWLATKPLHKESANV